MSGTRHASHGFGADGSDDALAAEVARLQARLDRAQRARKEAERLSEWASREVYERQRETALLATAAQAANDATDLDDALRRIVAAICEHTGWPAGCAAPIGEDGAPADPIVWHAVSPALLDSLRGFGRSEAGAVAADLARRTGAQGREVWVASPAAEVPWPSGPSGALAAFGVPMLAGSEPVGILGFLCPPASEPAAGLRELLMQIGGVLAIAVQRDHDRAARQRLVEQLAARAAELERSNAELEQFASIASHDLQEPLRKVRLFTEQVAVDEADALSAKGRDYLERANASAGRMQNLVEDLLTLSRVSTRGRSFAPVDLDQVTAHVLDDLHSAIERTGAVVRVGALPLVAADEVQMRQLMQNLVANALKFHRPDAAPEIAIDGVVRGDTAQVTVRDDGIGFDPQYAERIFRVFERLNGRVQYEGTGIGLALCRKIAERHGGTVTADAEPGAGATLTVTLPVRR